MFVHYLTVMQSQFGGHDLVAFQHMRHTLRHNAKFVIKLFLIMASPSYYLRRKSTSHLNELNVFHPFAANPRRLNQLIQPAKTLPASARQYARVCEQHPRASDGPAPTLARYAQIHPTVGQRLIGKRLVSDEPMSRRSPPLGSRVLRLVWPGEWIPANLFQTLSFPMS
jgi:hypothetical protein